MRISYQYHYDRPALIERMATLETNRQMRERRIQQTKAEQTKAEQTKAHHEWQAAYKINLEKLKNKR